MIELLDIIINIQIRRLRFNAYHEREHNNVHSNIILTVPPEYDDVNVMKIVFDMEVFMDKTR